MELPLIVGVDGSDSSFLAIDWAVDEAARLGLPLRLVYASLWERYEGAALPGSLNVPPSSPKTRCPPWCAKAAMRRLL